MSRRALPSIHPDDLRDHADEDRIARIWERIEHDISIPEAAPTKGFGFAFALVAATAAAFAGGLFIGRVTGSDPSTPIYALAPETSAGFEVLAAGTAERTIALPGGGHIKLSPGATVEVGRSDHNTLTIMLVQGRAAVDTTGVSSDAALAIVAGDARLQSRPGSVVSVQRNESDLGVHVTSGFVSITSPDGPRDLVGGQPQITVPIRTSTVVTLNDPVRPRVHSVRSSEEPTEEQPVDPPPPVVAAPPDWHALCGSPAAFSEMVNLMRQQPGGFAGALDSARSASELMCVNDAALTSGEQAVAIKALTRVVEKFPADPNAPLAAYTLGNMYQKSKQTELAQKYLALYRSLSPDGALSDPALCKQISAEMKKGRKEEAIRLAREYVAKYPDGSCKEDVERIIQGEEPAPDDQEPEGPPRAKDAPKP